MLNSSPAVAGGAVYVGGHYGNAYALSAPKASPWDRSRGGTREAGGHRV